MEKSQTVTPTVYTKLQAVEMMAEMETRLGETVLETVRQTVQAQREQLRLQILGAGSPRKWLEQTCPRLAKSPSRPDSIDQVLLDTHTLPAWQGAERRLGQCARCPRQGGGCADDESPLAPGQQPAWTVSGLEWPTCDRWDTWRLVKRMCDLGAPPAAAIDAALRQSVKKKLGPSATACATWTVQCAGGARDWLFVTGHRTGKTMLAMMVLRTLVKRLPRKRHLYVHASDLHGGLQRYWRDREEDPMEILRSAAVAIVDGVSLSDRAQPDSVRRELDAALRHRRMLERPTVILSVDSTTTLETAYPGAQVRTGVQVESR